MNVITTTPADTSSTTVTPQPKRTKRLVIGLVGSAVLIAGSVTAVVVNQGHGPATAPAKAPAVRQAGLVRADRLQGQADALTAVGTTPIQQAAITKADRLQSQADAVTTSGGDDVMGQIRTVTGVSPAAQQARTLLYQVLRNG